MSPDSDDEFSFTFTLSYWGVAARDFDRWINLSKSLVSKVTNQVNGDVYVILTAQEAADDYTLRDYWTSILLAAKEHPGFLLHSLKVYRRNFLEITRNSQVEAHEVHQTLKQIVKNEDWRRFNELAPDPVPPQGFSPDALRVLAQKGIDGDVTWIEAEVRARWKFGQEG